MNRFRMLVAPIPLGIVLTTGACWTHPASAQETAPPPAAQTPAAPLLGTVPTTMGADTAHIGLPEVLVPETGINDPVFAILAGLVTSGVYGTITEERLRREVARIGGTSRLPFEAVDTITREPVKPGWTALVRIDFRKPLDLPIPYSILSYHPGSFTATQHCLFREWEIGKIHLVEAEKKDGKTITRDIDLEDVHLFSSVEGKVEIDIDAWVDALLGGAIDDTDITALMLCRWQGEWYGVAMGYGKDNGGRSGILSLRRDKILFPPPEGLRGVGRQMRARAELLDKVWNAGNGGLEGRAGWDFEGGSKIPPSVKTESR